MSSENTYTGEECMQHNPNNADAMRAEIARLRAQIAARELVGAGRLTVKLAEKGGIAVYGLGRFPVTLYREQWFRLEETLPAVKACAEANKARCDEVAAEHAARKAAAKASPVVK